VKSDGVVIVPTIHEITPCI